MAAAGGSARGIALGRGWSTVELVPRRGGAARSDRRAPRPAELAPRGVGAILDTALDEHPGELSGSTAFLLHDTYGFPLELTQEIAGEREVAVDLAGFGTEMAEQRERAKAAQKGSGEHTDLDAYRDNLADIGAAYRETMGRNFPVMAVVGVTGLVEPDALLEIESTAVGHGLPGVYVYVQQHLFDLAALAGHRVITLGRHAFHLHGLALDLPGDISTAAFFLAAGAMRPGSSVVLRGVGVNPTRTGVLDALHTMGARIQLANERDAGGEPVADLRVRSAKLKGIRIPEEQVPLAIDEFPALFVAAACAEGETVLTGAEELRVKESDRIQVMADGLRALGVDAQPTPDGIVIQGGGRIGGGRVDSHGDHRIGRPGLHREMKHDGTESVTEANSEGGD